MVSFRLIHNSSAWPGNEINEPTGENKCKNIHKIGICKAGDTDNVMDFSEPLFQGTKGMYYKCNWSKKCNTPWEGIDNLC